MGDDNNQQSDQSQQSLLASTEPQAQPAQSIAASGNEPMQPAVPEPQLTREARIAAGVDKMGKELWGRPEFKEYTTEIIAVIIEANKKKEKPAAPANELEAFFFNKLQEKFNTLRIAGLELGHGGLKVYFMIWAGCRLLWDAYGDPQTSFPVPVPENQGPIDTYYTHKLYMLEEAAKKEAEAIVPALRDLDITSGTGLPLAKKETTALSPRLIDLGITPASRPQPLEPGDPRPKHCLPKQESPAAGCP